MKISLQDVQKAEISVESAYSVIPILQGALIKSRSLRG